MDPYTSPGAQQDDASQTDIIPDAGIEEHRLYPMGLNMVLWGEKKKKSTTA
ncbi:hypothetical protein [Luteolibacter sp. LG18]|uniref:hypothetical protein n=1 Tax=Luteolibacter sp. LG18 TaxID=2819286 RepID=UPI002B2C4A0D|nr:hypothetical protein llg_14620 [Luteolibacter sp. LG18]